MEVPASYFPYSALRFSNQAYAVKFGYIQVGKVFNARMSRVLRVNLKTHVSHKKLDGSEHVALANADVSGVLQAKHALAQMVSLPFVDGPSVQPQDIDSSI